MSICLKRLSFFAFLVLSDLITEIPQTLLAAQSSSLSHYGPISPKDAKRSLIGNSLKTPNGYYFFPNDHYAFYTSLAREKHCTIWHWRLTETESCRAKEPNEHCGTYNVLKSEQREGSKHTGRLGIFFRGRSIPNSQLEYSPDEGEILPGNFTPCPTFSRASPLRKTQFNWRRDFVRLFGQQQISSDVNVPENAVSALISGNIVLLHTSSDNDACAGGVLYFSPDGRIVSMICENLPTDKSHPNSTISMFVWHWRERNGRFESDDPAALGDFGASVRPKLKFVLLPRSRSDRDFRASSSAV